MTSEQERSYKTWVFLDQELAYELPEYPEFLPFKSPEEEHDVDSKSGIRIVWGAMDKEFSENWRADMLLSWLDEMKVKAKPFFDAFEKAARSSFE